MSAAGRALPFLDLAAVNGRFAAEFAAALERVSRRGHWVLGPEVEAFEHEFSAFCGSAHAVGVGNGLDAIELVLRAWGIGPGDEVIVPGHTFIATWLAVSLLGATVVPVDVDETSGNIDPDRIERAITQRTKAIVVVHLYGRPAEMARIAPLAHARGVKLLEDAAQAHGARCDGARAGALADAAAFSFYPAKNLGALGDGGAVTTNDNALAAKLRLLRNYGSAQRYVHQCQGRNSRLDELQAAILRVKLPSLDRDNARRAEIAARYSQALADLAPLRTPAPDSTAVGSAWHLYVVRHPKRDLLAARLSALGIGTQIHYPRPPHEQDAYAGLAPAGRLPVSERFAREALSLPIGPTLADADVGRVVAAVRTAVESIRRSA